VKPDEHVYSLTIRALCKLRDADMAVQVLGEMMEAGFRPWDLTLTYNFVVAMLVKAGRMEEALKVKDQMLLVAGKKMDVVLATTLMQRG
jgi:pentatricopeptide repeat protein